MQVISERARCKESPPDNSFQIPPISCSAAGGHGPRKPVHETTTDSRTGEEEANLEANLKGLLDRIKSGRYKAPPVRRSFIPKADGTQRPLGIPTFEDKVADG